MADMNFDQDFFEKYFVEYEKRSQEYISTTERVFNTFGRYLNASQQELLKESDSTLKELNKRQKLIEQKLNADLQNRLEKVGDNEEKQQKIKDQYVKKEKKILKALAQYQIELLEQTLKEEDKKKSLNQKIEDARRKKQQADQLQEEIQFKRKAGLLTKKQYEEEIAVAKAKSDEQSQFLKRASSAQQKLSARSITGSIKAGETRISEINKEMQLTREQLAMAETDEEKKALKAELRQQQSEKSAIDAQLVVMKSISNAVNSISKKMNESVNLAMENISKYMPVMDARLQGTGKSYDALSKMVRSNLAVSPFVKQVDVLESLSKLVHAGIVRDLEQRAFLNSVSEKISDTFNALDATLTRIVRLQMADSTAARLGMREGLTEFFNEQFLDSSYMNNMYDTVSGAIIEANSLLSREESVAFEYATQKWLGSLYSLGASESFISDIAKGINYLATGNVQGLASSTALQNLFAMSASRSGGKGYAEMLKDGINASDINDLMSSMVEYLQEIAEGSATNRVVRAAYGDVFGLAMSDITSATNIKNLQSIIAQNWDYGQSLANASAQVGAIASRTSISQIIENLFANAFYSLGSKIAENPVMYTLWKVADLIEGAGGIHLPNVGVLGNFLDLTAFTVEGIMKGGLIGVGTLSLIGDIISSISSGGGLSLGAWGPVSGSSRGGGGLSSSASYVTSGSSEDIQAQSLTSATEDAEKTSQITNKNVKTDHSFDDLYVSMFEEQKPIQVVVTNSVGVTLDDIEATEKSAIIEYIDEKVKSLVEATIASSFTLESGNSMAVTVINPEPVNVAISNPDIVDYYHIQSTVIPPIEG